MTRHSLALKAHLQRLAWSKRPILVGPWRSELGFEALYWLPFLRKVAQDYQIDPKRLVTVTRGGAGVLYGTQAIDLYRLRSVETVRLENEYDWQQTKLQKQTRMTPWDRDVLKEAAAQVLGRGERYHVLHPAAMYGALAPFWDEVRGARYLDTWTDYAPIGKLPPLQQALPPQYVAMKWYERPTLPTREADVQKAIGDIVTVVGAQTSIVLLTGTPGVDDHQDVRIEHPSVVTVPAVSPEENLGQQLRILSHAQAFIGTYGGMAQTALRLGVPSISLYRAFGGTCHAHLALSSVISKKTGVPFVAGSLADLDGWRKVVALPATAKEAA